MAVTIPETGYEAEERFAVLTEKRSRVNDLLKNFVQECGDKMLLSDLSAKLPHNSLSDEDKRKYWNDQLHFSPAGYDRMAEIIFEDVKHLFAEGEET